VFVDDAGEDCVSVEVGLVFVLIRKSRRWRRLMEKERRRE